MKRAALLAAAYAVLGTVASAQLTNQNDCANSGVDVVGPGAHPFNTQGATTGVEGQLETNCIDLVNVTPLLRDIWFTYVATMDGVATITTCPTQGGGSHPDTKLAVWPGGAACPVDGTSLDCADTACGFAHATVIFPITQGESYIVQVGSGPFGTGFTGTGIVDISEVPTAAPGCIANASFEGGDLTGWTLNDYAMPSAPTDIVIAGDGTNNSFFDTDPTDGNFSLLIVWDASGPDTARIGQDVMVTPGLMISFDWRAAWNFNLGPPATFDREFDFVIRQAGGGAELQRIPILTAVAGTMNFDTGTTTETIDLSAFDGTTVQIGLETFIPEMFTGPAHIEIDNFRCVTPTTSLCNGDGGDQMGCTDCPCGNNAPMGTEGGCLNSAGTASRLLQSGTTSVAVADLRFEASGVAPNNSCVLTSGNSLAPANMVNPCFGLDSGIQSMSLDGLRCAVQGVLRHGVRPSDGNGDVGVTTNGWGDPNGFFQFSAFTAGDTKHFQIIHRDNAMLGCGTGQNTSQAISVTFSN